MDNQNAIIGISGGITRLKGNSPKVSNKDPNRPRQIKQYGVPSAAIGGVSGIGGIGTVAV